VTRQATPKGSEGIDFENE